MRLNDPLKIHRVVSRQVRYQLRKQARRASTSLEARALFMKAALMKKETLKGEDESEAH